VGAWAKEKVLGEARMTAFDTAWDLLKDFTTDKIYGKGKNTLGFYVHDAPRHVFQPNDRFTPSPWDGPKIKQFEGEDYRQGSSRARGFRSTGGRVNDSGLNRLGAAHLPNILNAKKGEDGQYNEQSVIDEILEVLRHEWGHATTFDDIKEEMDDFSLRRKPQSQLQEEAKAQKRALEYAAYVAQGLDHNEIQEQLRGRNLL